LQGGRRGRAHAARNGNQGDGGKDELARHDDLLDMNALDRAQLSRQPARRFEFRLSFFGEARSMTQLGPGVIHDMPPEEG
jgi:hypothetical protein